MNKIKLKEHLKEIVLIILRKTFLRSEELKRLGDINGEEILNKEVILPYEKIYLTLENENIENLTDEEIEKIKGIISELKARNCLTDEEIEESLRLRTSLKEKSGAKVVKKLLEYQLNRLLERKESLIRVYEKLSIEEQNYENLLKETIQEAEQFDIVYKLHPIRKRLREYESEHQNLKSQIELLQSKLATKWSYEIYGTIDESELLKSYKDFFKLEEKSE